MEKTGHNEILDRLDEAGFKAKLVSSAHLPDLEESILSKKKQGLFDPEFYRIELSSFESKLPKQLPKATTLIVVAAPQPRVRFHVELDGKQYPVIVPPTYSYGTDKTVQRLIEDIIKSSGYRTIKARLPLKLLAVRSGLAKYGRNNISYVDGLGSFHRLAAFHTDLPVIEDNWQEMQVLDRCEKCTACIKACPSGAITKERFLIQAARCITFHNEGVSDFPEWLDPVWHNSWVGCLHCQRVCPMDKEVYKWVEDKGVMAQPDVSRLLSGAPKDELSDSGLRLIDDLGLTEYYNRLGRNLSMLISSNPPLV